MSLVLRAGRPARLAAIAALAVGLAGALAAAPARALAAAPVITGHAAVSWGEDLSGELGDGTTTNRSLFGPVSGLGSGVVQVAAGNLASLAVTSDGTVWAWGTNPYGQFGNGTTSETPVTVPVRVPGLTGVVAVSVGYLHCLALRSDGTVWAWGTNLSGQVGDGGLADALTPVQVTGLTGVTKIAAGGFFNLALRSDGTVWAWGDDSVGELGTGTTTNDPITVPVRVPGLSQVTGIAAGQDAGYAIRTKSITALTSLWAWGGNQDGELGDGTQVSRPEPAEVAGISAPSIAGVAAGDGYAVALGNDGSVWAWGDNSVGQLDTAPGTPVLRPAEAIGTGSGIIQLSASSGVFPTDHGHVLALRSDGTVLAWGDNMFGALGDGTTAAHVGAERVVGLTGVTQVSAGDLFSLAVTALAAVPDVRRLTTSLASSALQAAGFTLGPIATVPDYTCNHIGIITGQNPAPRASARLGSPVQVTVGGRPPTPCP
jgi:alpha-tubulin suppressor-like RCC1 family protein